MGKTELAKVLAATLVRPSSGCSAGLDVTSAVCEWNYPRQMLEIRLLEARGRSRRATARDIFGPEFLIRRPLLQALDAPAGSNPVLLIDEIDRADESSGVPARDPVRLPGDGARDRHDPGRPRPGDPDQQPDS